MTNCLNLNKKMSYFCCFLKKKKKKGVSISLDRFAWNICTGKAVIDFGHIHKFYLYNDVSFMNAVS